MAFTAAAETPPAAEVGIVKANRLTVIDVEIGVKNTDSHQVFIPECGHWNTRRMLCDLAVRLEVHRGDVWKEPGLGCDACGVPGGLPLDKGLLIAPGVTAYLTFQFAADSYRINRGDEVRLVIDTWPDLAAVKSGVKPVSLATKPFKLP
jgi:hypothetical protein